VSLQLKTNVCAVALKDGAVGAFEGVVEQAHNSNNNSKLGLLRVSIFNRFLICTKGPFLRASVYKKINKFCSIFLEFWPRRIECHVILIMTTITL
jgi:hypothetical protein